MATNSVHSPEFFKVYIPHLCSERLRLPLKFNHHFPQPLPETAVLRNSSGNFWRVGFTRRQEFVCFDSGWKKFTEDNDLKAGEFMAFEYQAPHTFLVRIFGLSFCGEKRAQVVVQEISEDTEEDVVDVGDFSDTSYSLQNEDETTDEEALLETPKRRTSDQKGQRSAGCREVPVIENPERYLDDPANPFFVTTLKNRNFELLVPTQTIKHHDLKFSKTISFIDQRGTLPGRFANWSDQRICFKGWNRVCRRNNLKAEDKVICELQHTRDVVRSIKVHIIRNRPEAS